MRLRPYIIILFFLAMPISFAWWDADWQYRKQINIIENSGTDLANYQVKLTIDTASLISAGKLNSDCSDIRFADQNDNLLSYWIESGCNTASTTIWVKVPSLAASSTQSIYMYYGNSEASSESNIADVMDAEVGSVVAGSAGATVNLLHTYANPVIVATWHETNGTQEASPRITSVSADSFTIKLQNSQDYYIQPQTVYYMVAEKGMLEFIDNTKLEAYTYTEASVQGDNTVGNWTTIYFNHTYTSPPVVIAQIQSNNDPTWATDHPYSITTAQFQNAMEKGEYCSAFSCTTNGHEAETMGYIAIESGKSGTINGVEYRTGTTGNIVKGHDNGCYYASYTPLTSSAQVGLSDLRLRDNSDGGWSVICGMSASQIGNHCEEEDASDGERRSHAKEDVSYVVFNSTGMLAVKKYVATEPAFSVGEEEFHTVCGDSVCEDNENYTNCPQDCCESDCTDVSDAICHIECSGYNGCSGFISACNNKSLNYLGCFNASYTLLCCATKTACSAGLYCNNGTCSSCSSVCDALCSGEGAACYGVDPDCDAAGNATLACCGNGRCEGDAQESCSNCKDDCGVCPSVEACDPNACKGSCGACMEYTCVGNKCVCQSISNCCGNSICEPPNETFVICPADCKTPSSIAMQFMNPALNQVLQRGDNLTVTVNVTFNEGIAGINANVTAKTPTGEITLYDDDLDGVYTNTIAIGPDTPTGIQAIEVTATRGVSTTATRTVQISNVLNVILSTDKGEYVKNEKIMVSGSVIDSLGRYVDGTLYVNLTCNGALVDSLKANVIGGFFNTSYRTSIIDPEGEWFLNASIVDKYNNTGSYYKLLTITSPPSGSYYVVNILSPIKGIIKRGGAVKITAEVMLGNTSVSNANVSVKLPNGNHIDLKEISEGTYSQEYTIPLDAPLGVWNLEVLAEKEGLTGVSVVKVNIEPADIIINVLSPTRSTYSIGEDLSFKIKATYPNGDPVDLPSLNVALGSKNLTLQSIGNGIYSTTYSVSQGDKDLSVKVRITDQSNNTGAQEFTIRVSGVSPLYYFKTYAYIIWPIIALALAGIVFFATTILRKKSITNLVAKKKTLLTLKKKAQKSYYIDRSISKERYTELISKYDSEIKDLMRTIKELKKKKKTKR